MYIEKFLAWAQAIPASTWQPFALAFICVFGCLIAFLLLAPRIKAFLLDRQARKFNQALASSTKIASFRDEDLGYAMTHYIEPDCLQTDMRGDADSTQLAAIRRKAFETVDDFLNKGSSRHLLVLADASMGKTAFCLNFHAREQRKKAGARRPIAIIPLSRPDALQQIAAVERKAETVLLLDALDEDAAASRDCSARLQKLMDLTQDFKAVILTSRDRLFLDDASIPEEFRTLYLLPFSAAQIEHMIRLQFPRHQASKRKKAREMVRRIPEIGSRPALLALLPDLVKKGKQITELFNVYALLAGKWVESESAWITSNTLAEFSKNLAVDIHAQRARTQQERPDLNALRQIAKDQQGTVDGAHFTYRSLLKCDSEGRLRFAHPSIMEFFFINAFIDGDERCRDVEWTEGMRSFFVGWGRSKDGVARIDRAKKILSQDLRKTGLLPLFTPGEMPRMFSSMEDLKAALQERKRIRSSIPATWAMECLRFSTSAEVMHVYDFAQDLKWKVVLTNGMSSYDERNLYRHPLSSLWKSNTGSASESSKKTTEERLPSVAELVSLWEAETALKEPKIFDRREFYWVGDKVGGYTYLACSVGKKPLTNELPISSSGVSLSTTIPLSVNGKQENLYIYEVMLRAASAGSSPFSAHTHMVESGVAEAAWYSEAQFAESLCVA